MRTLQENVLTIFRYVEMLEQQQTWLVNGLQELYQRLLKSDGWQGEPLKCESNGQPLTHDLLTQLGALDSSKHERFEEHPETMQQELWKQNAGHMQRQDSTDTSSESPHSPPLPPHFSDPFAATRNISQTPNLRIDIPQSKVKSEPQMTPSNPSFMHTISMPRADDVVDPLDLQSGPIQSAPWSGGAPFSGGYEDMGIMSAPYSGLPFDDNVSSPLFSRPLPMGPLIPAAHYMENEDISQFLDTQPEIAS